MLRCGKKSAPVFVVGASENTTRNHSRNDALQIPTTRDPIPAQERLSRAMSQMSQDFVPHCALTTKMCCWCMCKSMMEETGRPRTIDVHILYRRQPLVLTTQSHDRVLHIMKSWNSSFSHFVVDIDTSLQRSTNRHLRPHTDHLHSRGDDDGNVVNSTLATIWTVRPGQDSKMVVYANSDVCHKFHCWPTGSGS